MSSKKQVKSIVCNFVRSSYLLVVTKEEWRCVHMHHTYTHTYIYDKACFAMCKCVCMCKCIFSISCLCLHVLAVIWLARMFLFVIIWKHCYILTSKNSNINRKICHINHKIGGSNDIQAWIHKINIYFAENSHLIKMLVLSKVTTESCLKLWENDFNICKIQSHLILHNIFKRKLDNSYIQLDLYIY